ncbi:hypothetical protein [Halalkalibacter krulwichiae]|uniref:Uncharacterized protein n=1 Tax=Halalkalibacter krulwichiae TaxID=199441 RepID=A0A1X9MDD4_9BACI|nr:hypothetical protein [Halalkalibacter krulwichiae]ARK31449.1 hypothetical protein BkAM31D_17275 [Halalkalibacter krulwichiae]
MRKGILLFSLLFLLSSCGPQLLLEVDQEQTRIIFNDEIDMASLYVRLENNGQLPANELYARFILQDEQVQEAFGGLNDFVFSDAEGTPEHFNIRPDSSYFIAEAFSLTTELNKEHLLDSISIEVYDSNDNLLVEHTINQITEE